MDIQTLRRLELAGFKDSAAVSSITAGGILTSPFFANMPIVGSPMTTALLAGMGSAWLADRFSVLWQERSLLKNSIHFESSPPFLNPHDPKQLEDAIMFGYRVETGEPIYLTYEDLTRHISILGMSGVGKTVLGKSLMFQHIQKGGSLIFIDPKLKAEDLEDFYQMCAWAGRSQDLLILNPGNPSMSNTYNPILYGSPEEVSSRIMSLNPSTESSPGADHYKMSALQGVQTIIGALQTAGMAYNFIDLVVLLMNSKALVDLEKKLLANAPNHPNTIAYRLLLDKYRTVLSSGEQVINTDKLKDIFGGIAGRLFMFGTGDFGKITNVYNPEVNLFDAMLSGKIIYVQLPTMGKNEQAVMFAKMFMGDLRTAVSWLQALPQDQVPKIPIWAFIDEAGSIVNESWSRPFEQGRSARLILNPAAQTIANYEAVSPQIPQMVMGNCTTKIYFRMGTQESALQCADYIGMQKGVTLSLSDTRSTSSSAANLSPSPEANLGESSGLAFGEREQEEYVVHPDMLKKLDKGQFVMVFEGDKVWNLRAPMIKFDSQYQKAVGKARVNHFDIPKPQGINLFERVNEYLMPDAPKGSGKKGGSK